MKKFNVAFISCMASIVFVLTCSVGRICAQEKIPDRLVGTYKLVSIERQYAGGERAPVSGPLGDNPVGMLIYTSTGDMCASVMRPDRPKVVSPSRNPEDVMKAFDGYVGYCGKVRVNEKDGSVTHDITVSSIPDWIRPVKRFFEIDGKRLILKTPPITYGGQAEPMVNVIIWERLY